MASVVKLAWYLLGVATGIVLVPALIYLWMFLDYRRSGSKLR